MPGDWHPYEKGKRHQECVGTGKWPHEGTDMFTHEPGERPQEEPNLPTTGS